MDQSIDVQKSEEIEISDLLNQLSSTPHGLSSKEAQKRLTEYGFNEITGAAVAFYNFSDAIKSIMKWIFLLGLNNDRKY